MIVVDVETTGLLSHVHSIVSIGAVDFDHPDRQFYRECRIWDGAQADEASLAVNGFTFAQIVDSQRMSLAQAVGEFLSWAGEASDCTLAGHNTFFDHGFLRTSCERANMPWNFGHRIIDLHSVCWAHMVASGYTVPVRRGRTGITADAVFMYVGLCEEPRPHHGLVGAKMEAEAFSRLVRGKYLLDEYRSYPIPAYLAVAASDQQTLF